MANFFEQFNSPQPMAPKSAPPPTGSDNFFSQFDNPGAKAAPPPEAQATIPPPANLPSRANPMDILTGMGSAGTIPDPTGKVGIGSGTSLLMGLRDPVDAGAQMLARGGAALPAGKIQQFFQSQIPEVEKARAGAEASYQANSPFAGSSFDPWRAAGQMATTAPLAYAMPGAAATRLIPQTLSGIASGAAASAMQPVDTAKSPDFWHEKLTQMAAGAATGGATSAAMNTLARVVSPQTSSAAQKMLDAGVTPTPGQIMGGTANRIEEKLQSLPVIGDAITNAKLRGVDQFNRASVNQALAPIGAALDMKTPTGREAVDEMVSKISGAYDKILPQATVKADGQFAQDLGQTVNMVRGGLAQPQADQFTNILQTKLISKFSPSGGMTGEGWKEAESELGRLASGYRSSADFDQRQLGDALLETQSHLRDLLQRSNPNLAPQIQAANQAWALSRRISAAATKPTGEPGQFTPSQLVQAVRQLDPTRNKTSFARGNALMQDYAESAKQVLANRIGNSGTWDRAALIGAPLAAYHYGGPYGLAALAGGAGAALGAYSPLGQRAAAALLASRPAVAPTIAQGLRRGAPLAGAGLMSLLGNAGSP